MDFIQPIGPHGDLDPVVRVERLKDQQEERERQERERKRRARPGAQGAVGGAQEGAPTPQGPVEGDDGHLHIDVKA